MTNEQRAEEKVRQVITTILALAVLIFVVGVTACMVIAVWSFTH